MKADDIFRREFKELSDDCDFRQSNSCEKTSFACRDCICPILKESKDLKDAKAKFAALRSQS